MELPFKCEFPNCPKSYGCKPSLTRHVKIVHKQIRYHCTYIDCQSTFGQEKHLIEHINGSHLNIRAFKCTHCTRRFKTNYAAKCHIRTHTGEKPYVCDVCGQGFKQRSACKRHVKDMHEGALEGNGQVFGEDKSGDGSRILFFKNAEEKIPERVEKDAEGVEKDVEGVEKNVETLDEKIVGTVDEKVVDTPDETPFKKPTIKPFKKPSKKSAEKIVEKSVEIPVVPEATQFSVGEIVFATYDGDLKEYPAEIIKFTRNNQHTRNVKRCVVKYIDDGYKKTQKISTLRKYSEAEYLKMKVDRKRNASEESGGSEESGESETSPKRKLTDYEEFQELEKLAKANGRELVNTRNKIKAEKESPKPKSMNSKLMRPESTKPESTKPEPTKPEPTKPEPPQKRKRVSRSSKTALVPPLENVVHPRAKRGCNPWEKAKKEGTEFIKKSKKVVNPKPKGRPDLIIKGQQGFQKRTTIIEIKQEEQLEAEKIKNRISRRNLMIEADRLFAEGKTVEGENETVIRRESLNETGSLEEDDNNPAFIDLDFTEEYDDEEENEPENELENGLNRESDDASDSEPENGLDEPENNPENEPENFSENDHFDLESNHSENEQLEVESERLEKERIEAEKSERIQKRRFLRKQLEEKRLEKLEQERLEKLEVERLEKLKLERLEKLEKERLEKLEKERHEKFNQNSENENPKKRSKKKNKQITDNRDEKLHETVLSLGDKLVKLQNNLDKVLKNKSENRKILKRKRRDSDFMKNAVKKLQLE